MTSLYSSELSLYLICIHTSSCSLTEADPVGFCIQQQHSSTVCKGRKGGGGWECLLGYQMAPSASAESFLG